MAATFSIGGVSFGALNNSSGRKAISCDVDAPTYQKIRFHVPGTDGNFIVTGGKTGRRIVCRMRYINTTRGDYDSDAAAWGDAAVTIVDEGGNSYANCNLVSMTPTSRPRALGSGGAGFFFFDAMAEFTQDS